MSSTLSEQVTELEAERDQLKERVSLLEAVPRVPLKDFRVPRIITADELKVGQCIAFSVSDRHTGSTVWNVEHYAEGDRFPSDQLLTIVLLQEAPEPPEKPELPTEPGSVILVTEWKGEKLDQPIHAVRGHHMWHSIPGDLFPGGIGFADPFNITGWKPARIVVEESER